MKWKSRVVQMFSDDRGELDPAPIMCIVGCSAILAISGYDVVVNLNPFKPLETGGGCAALVASLYAARSGDAKVRSVSQEVIGAAPQGAPYPPQPPEHPYG